MTRINRWVQTGRAFEPKEMGCQTENNGALSSFGHVSDGAEHNLAFDGDTQNSTNLNLTTDVGGRNGRI